MKLMKYFGALLIASSFVGCSDWNTPERRFSKTRKALKNIYRCWRQKLKQT